MTRTLTISLGGSPAFIVGQLLREVLAALEDSPLGASLTGTLTVTATDAGTVVELTEAPQLEGAPEVAPETEETPTLHIEQGSHVLTPASGVAASARTVQQGQARCVHCGNPEVAHGGNSGRACLTIPESEFAAS